MSHISFISFIFSHTINILWNIFKVLIIIYYFFYNNIKKLYYTNNYNNIYLIKNNKVLLDKNITSIKSIKSIELPSYEYIIYKYTFENKILTKILYNLNNINSNTLNPNTLNPCQYQFIYITLTIDNKTIDITHILKDTKHFFYVIDAIIFNNIFMLWLIECKLNLSFDNYEIVILDNNMREIKINNTQYIKLNNDTYDIINI